MAEMDNLSENRALVRSVPPNGEDVTNETINTDFRQQVQQYGQQAADALNRAKDYAGQYIGQAGEKLKDLQNKDLSQLAEDAKDFARREPVKAIAITAAVGVVIGLLLGRRR